MRKPDYERGNVRLYCGDCMEILSELADNAVDIVVTSPPYNTLTPNAKPSGMHASTGGALNFITKMHTAYADDKPEQEYQNWLQTIVADCMRVSRGLVWVNHKVRYREGVGLHPVRFLPFPIYQEVIWHRDGAIAFNCKRYAPSHESLYAFGKPHYWDDAFNTRLTVWFIPSEKGKSHPCPFPLSLVTTPIASSCPEGGTVLDPFMGSGTTGVACVKEQRAFVGIELDRGYFDGAVARIDRVLDQKVLF